MYANIYEDRWLSGWISILNLGGWQEASVINLSVWVVCIPAGRANRNPRHSIDGIERGKSNGKRYVEIWKESQRSANEERG